MANTSIANLTAAGTLTGAEKLPLVQTNVTKRTTLSDIAAFVPAPAAVTISGVGSSITVTKPVMELTNTSGGNLTLTSTPTIPDGTEGQRTTLINKGSHNIVIQGESSLAGSNVKLGAATRTMSPGGTLSLVFDNGFWWETGFVTSNS